MTKTYYFYSAGSIPGIAGIFAGVAVTIDEDCREILSISPLGQASPDPAAPAPSSPPASPSPEAAPSIDLSENKE